MEKEKREKTKKSLSVDEEKLRKFKLDEMSGDNRGLDACPTLKEWEDCVGTNFIMGR